MVTTHVHILMPKGSYISIKDSAYDSVALKNNARDSPQDLKRHECNMVDESLLFYDYHCSRTNENLSLHFQR